MPAPARANRPHSPPRRRTLGTGGRRLSTLGLGGDPLEVGGQSALDWDRDDFRKFVRMALAQRLLERRIALARRLDQHRVFFIVLHGILPAVHRAARREDVDARRQVLLHERVGEPLGGWAIWQVSEHQERAHGRVLRVPWDTRAARRAPASSARYPIAATRS